MAKGKKSASPGFIRGPISCSADAARYGQATPFLGRPVLQTSIGRLRFGLFLKEAIQEMYVLLFAFLIANVFIVISETEVFRQNL
jgi:hypothetical protein